METDSQADFGRRLLGSILLLTGAAASLLFLAPDGQGGDGPVRVETGTSASVYRSVTEAARETPSWIHPLFDLLSQGTVAALALMLVVVWALAVRRGDARVVAGTMMLGLGTLSAYALSEVLKVMVYEERPCRALEAVAALAPCPAVGDWSFPSNHTTLAVGTAVGLAVLRPRLAVLTLPLGLIAAALRVAVGAHYPHDVLGGLILGATVSVAALLLLTPPVARLISPLLARLSGSSPGTPAAQASRHSSLDG